MADDDDSAIGRRAAVFPTNEKENMASMGRRYPVQTEEQHHAYHYTVPSTQLGECINQVIEGGGGPGSGDSGET
jgi:hypothetical protein